jgi:hypothetical protein
VCAVAFEAFTLVFGERYAPGVPVFRWYLVRIVAAAFVPQVLLENVGSTRRSLASSLAALGASALLIAVFVPVFDLPGAAAATVLAGVAVQWLLGGWLARKRLGAAWRDLLDWGHVGRLLAACGASAAVAIWAVPDGLVGDPSSAVRSVFGDIAPDRLAATSRCVRLLATGLVHGAAYGVTFAVLARFLRALSAEDVEMLRGLLRRRPAAV